MNSRQHGKMETRCVKQSQRYQSGNQPLHVEVLSRTTTHTRRFSRVSLSGGTQKDGGGATYFFCTFVSSFPSSFFPLLQGRGYGQHCTTGGRCPQRPDMSTFDRRLTRHNLRCSCMVTFHCDFAQVWAELDPDLDIRPVPAPTAVKCACVTLVL